jgi:acetolactate decarboxylase
MKNVMWEGRLEGVISLDTLSDKRHLYGLGPMEYLAGEIIVLDGKAYSSVVAGDSTLEITPTFRLKAPFFGYANISRWSETRMPDSVRTLPQLEAFLDAATKTLPRPFIFKLTASIDSADVHVVHLPKGAKVASPDDAHRGQREFRIRNKPSTLVGFFSTEHQTLFTHHDTFLHVHLLTDDLKAMGHLDALSLGKGNVRLFLPR